MTWTIDDRERHLEDAYERLGTRTPHCTNPECNESNPFALTGRRPDIWCYECQARMRGRSPTELHHPDGQRNSPDTVPIPGNDHRILSGMQRDWSLDVLRNPNGSPLLRASAALRGFLDLLRQLIDRILGWIPPYLESLDTALCERLGPTWWVTLGLEGET